MTLVSSKASTADAAPWLILAVGNPSRGDDALGPRLIESLALIEAESDDVDFLIDFQLQVEHALDLRGRLAVLFVDAARLDLVSDGTGCTGVELRTIAADEQVAPASHSLRAEAVLHVAGQIDVPVPPAWQLAIAGQSFSLGEGLSETAERRLADALAVAQAWLSDRRASRLCSERS